MQNEVGSAGGFRPLVGVCVMVTRPNGPVPCADPLAAQLRALGAEVVAQPAIQILPPPDWRKVDDALARLDQFDWLVFSSANGVRMFWERFRLLQETETLLKTAAPRGGKRDSPIFADTKIGTVPAPPRTAFPRLAAIGPGTADALTQLGLQADLVPKQFRAESLAEALIADAGGTAGGTAGGKTEIRTGRRFLLARASRGREALAEALIAAGAVVEQIVVYTSADVERPDADVAAMLRADKIAWVTVTSSAVARSLVRLFGDDLRRASWRASVRSPAAFSANSATRRRRKPRNTRSPGWRRPSSNAFNARCNRLRFRRATDW